MALDVRAGRFRSACASAQSDLSLPLSHKQYMYPVGIFKAKNKYSEQSVQMLRLTSF